MTNDEEKDEEHNSIKKEDNEEKDKKNEEQKAKNEEKDNKKNDKQTSEKELKELKQNNKFVFKKNKDPFKHIYNGTDSEVFKKIEMSGGGETKASKLKEMRRNAIKNKRK